jgi:methylmalonyl-CoA mutase, N-terminal domain
VEHIASRHCTASKIPLKEFYQSSRDPAPPGSFPFTRGTGGRSQKPPPKIHCVDGYALREAGATAIEEVAFSIALGIASPRGHRGDFYFLFSVQNDFFEEIAKFRAARTVWAKITKRKMRLVARTSSTTLVQSRPKNNVTRITYQTLAAVLGGAESIQSAAYDSSASPKTSAWVGNQIERIMANETGVANVADPLGGSYLIENLTQEIEKRALALIKKIDTMGGIQKAMAKRFPKHLLRSHHEK